MKHPSHQIQHDTIMIHYPYIMANDSAAITSITFMYLSSAAYAPCYLVDMINVCPSPRLPHAAGLSSTSVAWQRSDPSQH